MYLSIFFQLAHQASLDLIVMRSVTVPLVPSVTPSQDNVSVRLATVARDVKKVTE